MNNKLLEKEAISAKRKARKLAVQALYQWLMSKTDLYEIETQFRVIKNLERINTEYFCQLLYGVAKHLTEIEQNFSVFLDRDIGSLNPIELTIIRLGTYELLYCLELPYKVVLDEAVSLTKSFGSQEGHRYVNGVLNQLSHKIRNAEIQASHE